MRNVGGQRQPALDYRTERGVCRCDRIRYIGLRVLSGDEAGLVCRRRQVHAALKHGVEKAVERFLVALHDLRVGRRRYGTKIQTEPTPHVLRRERDAALARRRGQALAERACCRGKSFIEAGRLEFFEGRKSCSYRERIARKRAGLVYRAERCDFPHDVAATAECSEGHPPADYLAERDEVRSHSVELLGAPQPDAKARHHFIKNQNGPVPRAVLPNALEKPGLRRDQAHVPGNRLDDHAGDGIAELVKRGVQPGHIVVVKNERLRRGLGRYAGRTRIAQSERARTGLDEQAVDMSVITALELDDAGPSGESTREPQCRHGRLGSGADQSHRFKPRDESRKLLGHLGLGLGRRAEGKSAARRLPHCGDDLPVRVPENERSPGADVIEVFTTVGVPNAAAFAAHDEGGGAADGAKRTYRGVDPAGDSFLCASKQRFVLAHGFFLSKRRLKLRAAASMSGAPNSALITATASAPASMTVRAFLLVMAPIATTGKPRRAFASR